MDLYFRDDEPADNFESMLYAKFGKGIAERFRHPLQRETLHNRPNTPRRRRDEAFFPYADVPEIIANFGASDNASYNATFTYPEGGAIQYVKAIAAGVEEDRISF